MVSKTTTKKDAGMEGFIGLSRSGIVSALNNGKIKLRLNRFQHLINYRRISNDMTY